MKEIYQTYCDYNFWANRRLTAIFKDLPEEKTDQFVESSYPSAKKTILHIWDAEVIWLKRLHGEHIDHFPSINFSGSNMEAVNGLLKTSQDFKSFVGEQEDEFFGKTLSFSNTRGDNYLHSVVGMIHHCMNHSTYHRGQLVMMARQLGLKSLPSTDMITYLRELGQ